MPHQIKIKRVYEPAKLSDGFRILVDRLWPRGISKQKAHIDFWAKKIAPSNELRQAFHAGTLDWKTFQKLYRQELKKEKSLLKEFKDVLKKHTIVTFVFGAKDIEHNNAVVLEKSL